MSRFKNQNLVHATINNKKTICGLSNDYDEADTLLRFSERLTDKSWTKYCCKKCQTKIK